MTMKYVDLERALCGEKVKKGKYQVRGFAILIHSYKVGIQTGLVNTMHDQIKVYGVVLHN